MFAVPLLNAIFGCIPERHDGCREYPCLQCKADRNLTKDDLEVIEFLSIVRDQVIDMTPTITEGPHDMRPRLEGWVAACELYDVPKERREHLVDMARCLFGGVNGTLKVPGLHRIDPARLVDPTVEELDG